ncbi:bacillithiol biosynthesis deacetylase BshB2 [Pullulanibacillus pueri]|uniref:Bacillithiol biosynthesis deacetylase BshB2 n=1 Tax=Pullulanibacillus pueri TaxID=1437324 RepID=A0A8J2ZUL2_9BACL|nr:bacillithiol biosynthesis deacetylase BshB2 [Pullulanibacillus pueri]MBM7681167.1 bacillithiol biosynthesis deacetylase BshB2 [Pullulanibacillus pueri]GGH77309.1 bacillithiol biosynthesis deacetylase BshB2 [Pullulanibacillus pueri]
MEKHVLIAFPHPDDEAFGVAGTIIQQTQAGVPVTYACGTLGEMGRNMGQPFFATRESLPEIRKKELQDACRVMGIQDLRMMGLRDKTVEFENEDEIADKIFAIIEEIQPSLVITFYPGFSVHPDHDAFGAAVINAVMRLPDAERPRIHCKAFSKDCEKVLGKPDIVTDVSEVFRRKLDTIRAHKSQTEANFKKWDEQLVSEDPELINWLAKETFWTYQGKKD